MGITHTVTKLNESHGNATTHLDGHLPIAHMHQDGMTTVRIPLTQTHSPGWDVQDGNAKYRSPNLRGAPAPWQRVTSCLDWAELGVRYQKSWMGSIAFVEWSEWGILAPPPAGSAWKCRAEGDEAVAAPGGSGVTLHTLCPSLHWQHSPARRVSSWRCKHRRADPALQAPTHWALVSALMSGMRCLMASPMWPPAWRWMTALVMQQRTAQRELLCHWL